MTAYFVGDIPAEPIVIEPARGGEPIELDNFTGVTLVLRDPYGEIVVSPGLVATLDAEAGTVSIAWPATSLFVDPGVYELTVKLTGASSQVETLSPFRIIVELEGSGWYTLDLARLDWDGAPIPSDNNGGGDYLLFDLLRTAQFQVLEYAPASITTGIELGGRPPFNLRKAQLMHVRTLANADDTDPNGQQGFDGFVVVPKSLEKNTREVIRPKNPAAVIA